jgi:hypothetical protein
LPGITGEDVEAERGERKNQELRQDRPEPVVIGNERNDHEGENEKGDHSPLVLNQREDRLVSRVAGLELARLPIEHGLKPSR